MQREMFRINFKRGSYHDTLLYTLTYFLSIYIRIYREREREKKRYKISGNMVMISSWSYITHDNVMELYTLHDEYGGAIHTA